VHHRNSYLNQRVGWAEPPGPAFGRPDDKLRDIRQFAVYDPDGYRFAPSMRCHRNSMPFQYIGPHAFSVCEQIFMTNNSVKPGDTIDADRKNVFKSASSSRAFSEPDLSINCRGLPMPSLTIRN
jgi:hypothetical protein